jgi:hypothetical protein
MNLLKDEFFERLFELGFRKVKHPSDSIKHAYALDQIVGTDYTNPLVRISTTTDDWSSMTVARHEGESWERTPGTSLRGDWDNSSLVEYKAKTLPDPKYGYAKVLEHVAKVVARHECRKRDITENRIKRVK